MVKVIMCFYHFDQSINVELEQSLRTFKGGLISIRKEAQSGRENICSLVETCLCMHRALNRPLSDSYLFSFDQGKMRPKYFVFLNLTFRDLGLGTRVCQFSRLCHDFKESKTIDNIFIG